MPITDITQSVGSWNLTLSDDIPPEVWDKLAYWGHVVVVRGRGTPVDLTDALLAPGVAAYVAPVRERDSGDTYRLAGPGMAAWLGDEDGKGSVYETAVDLTDATVPDAVRALLPASGAVVEGTLYPVTGRTYTGHHVYEDPRTAITYVCQTVSTDTHPVSWRVNGDATLDVGLDSDLFVTDPKCIIVRKGAGEDLFLRARSGSLEVASDLEDYTTRVVLLAEGDGDSIATGSADIAPDLDPYLDLHGNPVRMTRLVSESGTETGNADTRAQLQLNRFSGTRDALTLTATDYDVQGDYAAGDYVYVYDPDSGLVDTSVEATFRGLRINPIKLKVTEVDWPVTSGHTVAYRAGDGTWTDLTDYVVWESPGGVKVTVGDFQRALSSSSTEPVGSRPNQDTSVPGVPTFVEPFTGSAYLDSKGFTRARVLINWDAPNNVDGSTVRDGDHYEIRYATDTDSVYPATWSAVSQIRWEDMQTWAQPFAAPDTGWQTVYQNWDTTTVQLNDLSPGVGYDVQIRAVDTTGNLGDWSATVTFVATSDNIPPSTPAAPEVAASRIALQITHRLGKASGGVFTLESDLDHLEVHAAADELFTPGLGTMLGKLKANAGMIQGQVPAVGTYGVETTDAIWVKVVAVDIAGNRSGPSTGVQSTALLIDDQHIDSLTVSKITAGTITSSWVMAGEIKTADTGARARISAAGYELFNSAGTRTFYGEAATGNLSLIGQLSSSADGRRVVVNPSFNPEIRFYADSGTDYSYLNAFSVDQLTGIGFNSSQYEQGDDTLTNRMICYPTNAGLVMQVIDSATQGTKGGYAQAFTSGATIGYQYGSTNPNLLINSNVITMSGATINLDAGSSGTLETFGKVTNYGNFQCAANQAVFWGRTTVPANFSGVDNVYGPTMAHTPYPMVTMHSPTLRTFQVTSLSSTQFGVDYSGTASTGAVGYAYMVFQV